MPDQAQLRAQQQVEQAHRASEEWRARTEEEREAQAQRAEEGREVQAPLEITGYADGVAMIENQMGALFRTNDQKYVVRLAPGCTLDVPAEDARALSGTGGTMGWRLGEQHKYLVRGYMSDVSLGSARELHAVHIRLLAE